MRRACLIVCAIVASVGCGPKKPVVTNGASGTDVNSDRRADLLAVSRTNGAPPMSHGLLILPGTLVGLNPANATGVSTYADGTWAARMGDVNRDGYSDFMLGSDSGSGSYDVRVFLGGVQINQQMASLRSPRREDGATGKTMGSAAGDLNGDGFVDVVVVRRWRTVAVHFGSASGLRADPDQTVNLGDTDPIADLRGVGDIDGDGRADVAFVHRIGERDTVRVHRGSPAGIEATHSLEIANVTGGVADRVDVNGDGRGDLVLGAIDTRPGCVHVLLGASGPPTIERLQSVVCSARSGMFATPRVARAGDVDADGNDDIVLFEPGLESLCASTTPVAYRLRVFRGTARGLEAQDSTVIDGPPGGGCAIGVDVTAVGDLHGDGYADLLVGIPASGATAAGQDGPGRIAVYRGSADGLTAGNLRWVDGMAGTQWGLGRFSR
jgi:hypothetical protein